MLEAGSTGTLQCQPHSWSSSPKPFGLIFSHQLTQSQKRPRNANSLLVQLCAPRCCPASTHRSWLPGALVRRHMALSLQVLKGSEPLFQHPWRPHHSTRRGAGHWRGSHGIPPLSSVLQAWDLALGLRALALFIHRPGTRRPGPVCMG